MKLKYRILIGFLLVTLIPILLFTATFYGFRRSRMEREKARVAVENAKEEILISAPDTEYEIMLDGKRQLRVRITSGELFAVTFLILICTSVAISLWIYYSIAIPLYKLNEAAKNIKDGNLDFKTDISGKDEIGELCRNFEEMRLRLKESSEEKLLMDQENRELISNISHDLRTPLTAIRGYVEGIQDGIADTPEKMDRYLTTIYHKTMEMDHLIHELTFYSRIDTNRIPYDYRKLPVKEYFDECARELSVELATKGTELIYTNDAGAGVMIIGDPEQLKRVIHNIVGNSVKYADKTKDRQQILFRVRETGDFIQIELEDNGLGIPKKNLPFIFDRFYRTDASRSSSGGGSGIGLSIVKKIIEDHSGRVWALSEEGKGTTICMVLRIIEVTE